MDTKKLDKKKILFILSIVIAVVLTIRTIGYSIVLPFPSHVDLDMVVASDINKYGASVVADTQGERMILLDNDLKVKKIIKMGGSSLLDHIVATAYDDEHFYIAGTKMVKNSDQVYADRVVRYDLNGKNPVLIYEIKAETNRDYGLIMSLSYNDNKVYISTSDIRTDQGFYLSSVIEADVSDISNIKTSYIISDVSDLVYSASFDPVEKVFSGADYFGRAFVYDVNGKRDVAVADDKFVTCMMHLGFDQYLFIDGHEYATYINDQKLCTNKPLSLAYCDKSYVYYNDIGTGEHVIYDINTGETLSFSQFDYSFSFILKCIIDIAGIAYLSVLLLILIFKAVRNAFKEKKYESIKRASIILIGIIAIVFISSFYTKEVVSIKENAQTKGMFLSGDYFAKTIDRELTNGIDFCDGGIIDINDDYKEAAYYYNDYFGKYSDLSLSHDYSTNIRLFWKEDDGYAMITDTSYGAQIGGFVKNQYAGEFFGNDFNNPNIEIYSNGFVKYYLYTSPVYDDNGEITGFVQIFQDYNYANSKVLSDVVELSMRLITIFVAIYVLSTEAKAFIVGLNEKKRRTLAGDALPALSMMHTINFCYALMFGFINVILVLIAKDLCVAEGYDEATTTYLIGIPALLTNLGNAIGAALYMFVSKKMSAKKMMVFGASFMMAAFIATVYAVKIESFVLFCTVLPLASVASGLPFSTMKGLILFANNEEEQFKYNKEFGDGSTTSQIAATMVGGLVAQTFGNAAVFICSAGAAALLIVISIAVLPKGIYFSSNKTEGKKCGFKDIVKFLTSGPMLGFLIFFVLPFAVNCGYKSFIFPVFSTAMNLSKSWVSNLNVFSKTINMIVFEPISKALKKFDYWVGACLSLLIIGIGFLLFAVNSTIYWAVIMLVITGLAEKYMSNMKTILWGRQAEGMGYQKTELSGVVINAEQTVWVAQSPVMSFMLSFGNVLGCVLTGGAFCAACAGFTLLTKNSSMSNLGTKEKLLKE